MTEHYKEIFNKKEQELEPSMQSVEWYDTKVPGKTVVFLAKGKARDISAKLSKAAEAEQREKEILAKSLYGIPM